MNGFKVVQFILLTLSVSVMPGYGAGDFKVLVFSRTMAGGTRHASIPAGRQCVREMAMENGFEAVESEDTLDITAGVLSQFNTVIFLNAWGEILGPDQESAFENYFRSGGGWVGIHGAAMAERSWAWYGGLLGNDAWQSGANFGKFPTINEAKTHFITRDLPDTLRINDEYYDFATDPGVAATILFRTDERPVNSAVHPSAWCHEYEGGRAVYTTWGHYDTTFQDTHFRKFFLNAILWSARMDSLSGTTSGALDRRRNFGRPDLASRLFRIGGENRYWLDSPSAGWTIITLYNSDGRIAMENSISAAEGLQPLSQAPLAGQGFQLFSVTRGNRVSTGKIGVR